MSGRSHLIFSNQIEILAEALCKTAFTFPPLSKKYVLVENFVQKRWLQNYLASFSRLGVCTGLIFLNVESFMLEQKEPSFLHYFLALQYEVTTILVKKEGEYTPLIKYLLDEKGEINYKKKLSFCNSLAMLFKKYFQEGSDLSQAMPWQRSLWNCLFENWGWKDPIVFTKECKKLENTQIHLFAVGPIPKTYIIYFQELAKSVPVFQYLVSPSKEYWTDMATPKESKSFLNGYLPDENPFLAHFGKAGREYFKVLDEWDSYIEESYVDNGEKTLLEKIQQDICVAKPKSLFPTLLKNTDDSLAIHLCGPSKMQEIQILYDRLSDLLKKYSFSLNDILVLAPNMEEYLPYISLIFGAEKSSFAYRAIDCFISHLAQGILQIMELAYSNWEVEKILTLLRNPAFQKRYQLKDKEIDLIKQWILSAKIYYSFEDNLNSFKKGGERLLRSLIESPALYKPELVLNFSDAELLNTFLQWIEILNEDVSFLKTNPSLTLSNWIEYLSQLKDRYFEEEDTIHPLAELLAKLYDIKIVEPIEFHAIYAVLQRELSKPIFRWNSPLVEGITFTTLQRGTVVPSKVICLLGMGEDTFPRKDLPISFSILKEKKKEEEDRYLFLQILITVKERLLIFYSTKSPEDGRELMPSTCVQDFLRILNEDYLITGKKISESITYTYPHLSFHKSFFIPGSPILCYDENLFQAAKSYSQMTMDQKKEYVFEDIPSQESTTENMEVDLKSLVRLMSNPVQFYLNQVERIYLEKNEREKFYEEQFSYKPFFSLQDWIEKPLLARLKSQGKTPVGLFGELYCQKFQEELFFLRDLLADNEVKDLCKIILVNGLENSMQKDGGTYLYPALQLKSQGSTITMVGELLDISPKGLVIHEEKKFATIVRKWPTILIYLCLFKNIPDILFVKKKLQIVSLAHIDPLKELSLLISYYRVAKNTLSPFFPTWANAFLKKDGGALKKEMQKIHGGFVKDPYLSWLLRGRDMRADKVFSIWAPYLRNIFASLTRLCTFC